MTSHPAQPLPSPSSSSTTTTTTTTPQPETKKQQKQHRSVRSLTREYESSHSHTPVSDPTRLGPSPSSSTASLALPPSSSPSPSPSPASSPSSSPSVKSATLAPPPLRSNSTSSLSSSSAAGAATSQAHARRPSVLIASPSYPNTLATRLPDGPRPRTLSTGSTGSASHARSPSVLLASASYPSTLQSSSPSPTSTFSVPAISLPPASESAPALSKAPAPVPTHVTNATTTSMSAAVAHSQPSTPHRRKGSREAVLPTLSVSLDGEDEGAEEHEAGFVNSANQSPSPTYRQGNAGWQAYNELEHGHEHEHEQGSPSSQHALGARGSNNGRNGGYNYSPDEGDETVYEELDAVPELGNGRYGPSPSSSSSSLLSASNSGSSLYTAPSGSPMKPASQMTAAERREHSRRHSRVHSRNLSVFFPRPGTEAQDEADVARASAVFGNGNVGDTPPRPQLHVDTLGTGPAELGGISPTKARRGHHHKHSVSFAMFEDPSPAGSSSVSPSPLYDPSPAHEHAAFLRSEPAPAHSASPDPVFLPSLPPLPSEQRGLAIFGFLHFVLGAALWVAGQAGDSLAATGLGYLVVFDALGVLSAVGAGISAAQWRREQDRRAANSTMGMMGKEKMQDDGVRRPYGTHRVETLLHFVQSIYLLFASVYVCKESIEHALLEGSAEHAEDGEGLVLPTTLLALATAACIFSNIVLKNHSKLVAACGISTAASEAQSGRGNAHRRSGSVLVHPSTMAGPLIALLANPFSLTVLFFSTILLFAGLSMPPFQVAALDKVLAGLESVSMFYVAYPASAALGRVLLQTAPPQETAQNLALIRALRTIEEHPLVTYVAPPHLWQLTPPTSALSAPGSASRNSSTGSIGAGGGPRGPKNAALVATLDIFLRSDATEADCLDITRWAWERAAPALGAGAGLRAGESLRGSMTAGELNVAVQREGARDAH